MAGNEGADLFQVMVATPEGLKRGSEHQELSLTGVSSF